MFACKLPSEIQFPIETTPRHIASRNILKRIVANYIYDGANNRGPILGNSGEQRFQPTLGTFAVRIEERYNLTLHVFRPKQSSSY